MKTAQRLTFNGVKHPATVKLTPLKNSYLIGTTVNEFNKRVFKIFRNTLKYGDQVFVRDPETFQWSWVEMTDVNKVIVNESEGKKPEQYVIKNINPNFENLTVTAPQHTETANMQPSSTTTGYNNASHYSGRQTETSEIQVLTTVAQ